MHPPQVVPCYYRASRTFEQNDITVTTLVTFNRFNVCSGLTIVLQHTPLLDALRDLCVSTPAMSTYVDIHLVFTPFDRRLNTWGNAARLFSRTEFAMMLDVDYIICTNFRSATRASLEAKIGRILKEEHDAPCGTCTLLSLVKVKKIDIFHRTWAPGHNGTDYPCDERFVGYRGNKAACLYEVYLSGMSFYVLADHFLVHQSHAYEEEARTLERKSNRKIYQDFKEEVYLWYLKRHYDSGTLNTSHGYNLQEECRKIRGVSKIAALASFMLVFAYPSCMPVTGGLLLLPDEAD
ncbi:hypothetical protein DFJ58DRAFT_719201 [Suillus subalutaceus]|uniref:uncharacterized protein n=1 Tax=Suillus subalutaceus TaxID=48586 RepID=UPI001B875898|nr:uncharacterized protein DFJ58DRAFT_719201 [Suillus subalutaceus]KAG1835985.1 hypothetical protein DFJ58DRAFT_719201 [Suillus subalutaceus]